MFKGRRITCRTCYQCRFEVIFPGPLGDREREPEQLHSYKFLQAMQQRSPQITS